MSSRQATAREPVEQAEEWFRLYVDDVYRYVARRVGADLAADLVSDTFRHALERSDAFDASRGSPRSWLFGIATNLVRRHWRSERRRLRAFARAGQALMVDDDPHLAIERQVDAAGLCKDLEALVVALPQGELDVLVLTAWEEMSSAEISEILGIPAGTVRSRLSRIRDRAREMPAGSRFSERKPE